MTKPIIKPDFATLVKECNKKKIDCYGMDRNGLFFALAGESKLPEFEKVGVFKRNISDREMKKLEDKQQQIPQKTVYPIELESKVLAIIEKNPLSFNNYDFTNNTQVLNFTFEQKFECFCGNTIEMVRKYYKKDRKGMDKGSERKEFDDIKYCENPHCLKDGTEFKQRKWIYLD